jgi:hypothetical protein
MADGDVDFLREGVRVLAQAVMEAEVTSSRGARGERDPERRLTSRNGYRSGNGTLGWERSSWPSRVSATAPSRERAWGFVNDLSPVLSHEFGHALGLGNCDLNASAMCDRTASNGADNTLGKHRVP